MNEVPNEILVPKRRQNILINYLGQRAAAYLIDACAPRDPPWNFQQRSYSADLKKSLNRPRVCLHTAYNSTHDYKN